MPKEPYWIQQDPCGAGHSCPPLLYRNLRYAHGTTATRKVKIGGQERPPYINARLNYFDLLIHQFLVAFVHAAQFEGIRYRGLAFFHAGNYIGAADPVSLSEISRRP